MTNEERARKLMQHIYHLEDLCDDASEIPLWAVTSAEAAIQQAKTDERRKVYEEVEQWIWSATLKLSDPLPQIRAALRHICKMEESE